jgi:fructosamine-3-kinase
MPDWPALSDALRTAGIAVSDVQPRPVGGGDVSAAWRIAADTGPVFLKTGANLSMFEAEAAGLRALGSAQAIRVPAVLAVGSTGPDSYLALEWLEFESPGPDSERQLGQQLALQHKVHADAYGWERDNTIGPTLQTNRRSTDWTEFFLEQRLKFQLELAARSGFGVELETPASAAVAATPKLLAGHNPLPSLLHGDLWGGNHACVAGQPVIFDPAVYFGDRETDLAMTQLFGGFSREFYAAYSDAWPLEPGYEKRLGLYQLYHVLNHLNLFGRAYLDRARSLLAGVADAA